MVEYKDTCDDLVFFYIQAHNECTIEQIYHYLRNDSFTKDQILASVNKLISRNEITAKTIYFAD